jgi:hypothetical protein
MKMPLKILILSSLFLLTPLTLHSSSQVQVQPGIIINASNVTNEPNRKATVLYEIGEQQPIYILERYRSWYRIQAENRPEGWVRLLAVKYLGEAKAEAVGFAEAFNRARAQSYSGPTVTTGVRGIDQQDFKNATPDINALNIILARKSEPMLVTRFAKQGNLKAKKIALPASRYKEETND